MAVDAQSLRKTGLYDCAGPLQSLVNDIESISGIIDGCKSFRHKLRIWSLFCLLGAIILFITALVMDAALLLSIALFLLLLCIVLLIYSFFYATDLLSNRNRHELLKQLLTNIQHDAPPDAKFSLWLSLTPGPELLSEAPWPERRNGKEQFYKENWIRIEGPLADGTNLTEDVTELSRKRTYLNRSGKQKTKTRSRYILTVRAAYPRDRYGDLSTIAKAPAQGIIRIPDHSLLRSTRINEKDIRIKAMAYSEEEIANTIAMMSLGAYRVLNRARRGDAA